MAFLDVLFGLTPELMLQMCKLIFGPVDALFYAIAMVAGYTIAIRKIRPSELMELARTAAETSPDPTFHSEY